jgi:predicted lysophospholipase L1 biosynthesis ABC-type transport system permease subunit
MLETVVVAFIASTIVAVALLIVGVRYARQQHAVMQSLLEAERRRILNALMPYTVGPHICIPVARATALLGGSSGT